MGADIDLETPLAKTLRALDQLRSDPRAPRVREGKLALDADVSRWLFEEGPLVPPAGRSPPVLLTLSPEGDQPATPERVPLPLLDGYLSEARRLAPRLTLWDEFDIREVERLSGGRPLVAIGLAAIEGLGLASRLPIDLPRLTAFLEAVEAGYKALPYHNRTHAADVCQSMAVVLLRGGLASRLSDIEQLAAFLACVVHGATR
eukprot:tig00021742_g23310.t1